MHAHTLNPLSVPLTCSGTISLWYKPEADYTGMNACEWSITQHETFQVRPALTFEQLISENFKCLEER